MSDFFHSSHSDDLASKGTMTRRGMLSQMGVAGFAMLVSASPASAFFLGSAVEEVDLDGLPEEWVERQGGNLNDYAHYLAKLRLKHVTPRQVIDAHAKRRGSVWNSLPPRKLWKNIKPTLKAIDRMGASLDQSVSEVVSVYRSPAYNARCRGASRRSWHLSNVAVDVKFPIRANRVTKVARALRSRGAFRGGVGSYSSFTHVDTRGQNVDW